MTAKGSNLFDESSARCVHLYTQVERGDSKLYKSDSIGNSQGMLTENRNKRKLCYSQNKDLSGK